MLPLAIESFASYVHVYISNSHISSTAALHNEADPNQLHLNLMHPLCSLEEGEKWYGNACVWVRKHHTHMSHSSAGCLCVCVCGDEKVVVSGFSMSNLPKT